METELLIIFLIVILFDVYQLRGACLIGLFHVIFQCRNICGQPVDKPNLCCQRGARLQVSLAQGIDGSERLGIK